MNLTIRLLGVEVFAPATAPQPASASTGTPQTNATKHPPALTTDEHDPWRCRWCGHSDVLASFVTAHETTCLARPAEEAAA